MLICRRERGRIGPAARSVWLNSRALAGAGWDAAGRRRLEPVLALSLLWRFHLPPDALSGLSLATGIAVAHALQQLGVTEVGLKWPNDVWWRERKLGGILLESGSDAGVCYVVAGIGLNVNLPSSAGDLIDQPWVDLQEIMGTTAILEAATGSRRC